MNDYDKKKLFCELKRYYQGFFIQEPLGNNAFSYMHRGNKRIYVAPLKEGTLDDVIPGDKIAFSEMTGDREKNVPGLESFIYWENNGKHIFVFDNHNHAFSFWSFGKMAGLITGSETLVHVDQHKDTRDPDTFLPAEFWENLAIHDVCDYVNCKLNVGNFINPAFKSGLFYGGFVTADHEAAFDKIPDMDIVADIDLDIFADEMDYIPRERKIVFIRNIIKFSSLITIATSPYFIDQDRALGFLKEIF